MSLGRNFMGSDEDCGGRNENSATMLANGSHLQCQRFISLAFSARLKFIGCKRPSIQRQSKGESKLNFLWKASLFMLQNSRQQSCLSMGERFNSGSTFDCWEGKASLTQIFQMKIFLPVADWDLSSSRCYHRHCMWKFCRRRTNNKPNLRCVTADPQWKSSKWLAVIIISAQLFWKKSFNYEYFN